MKRLIAISTICAALAAPHVLLAETKQINPWQHCGIGAGIFDDNTTAAAISNIIWDSGTTAVTSATMSPEICSSKDLQVSQFIQTTYDTLIVETAVGEGQHLNALLELQGVGMNDRQSVISQLREDLLVHVSDERQAELSHSDKAFQMYVSLNEASGS
jgi:hypothetical protein